MQSADNTPEARYIAFYLPQFHPIPENDKWWGKGFTEWTNVGKARKLYPGHYQPKLPGELGYYDLRVPQVREQQAALARQYGIEGFCYWHYWFGNGKRLLEQPFEEVVKTGKPDFPFCLAWANESWRGFHHGVKKKETLIDQTYGGADDNAAHFNALLPAFKDQRYLTVDGKPLFLIYQPLDNKEAVTALIAQWRQLAEASGLPGIWFVGITAKYDQDHETLMDMGFDGINVNRFFEFKKHHRFVYRCLSHLHHVCKLPRMFPYRLMYPVLVGQEEANNNVYPTLYPNWDHTPRTGRKGNVFTGVTPKLFGKLIDLCLSRIKEKPLEQRLVFIKSWNEWGEGNYLEPDRRYGRAYLEELGRRANKTVAENPQEA